MKKSILAGFVLSFFLLTAVIPVLAKNNNPSQCNANNPTNCPIPTVICDNGEHVGNPHCLPSSSPTESTPTGVIEPTLGVTPEVSVSPTATPEATLAPTEVPQVVHGDNVSDGRSDGRSSSPQPTLMPCSATTCGWK